MTQAGREPVWSRALRWAEAHRRDFALPRGGEPELFRVKTLGELAAVVSVLARRPDLPGPAAAQARGLLEFAWEEFERGALFARWLDGRPLPVLGTMYAVFERLGLRHEPTRQRLAALAEPGALARKPAAPAEPAGEPVAARYGLDGVVVLCLGLGHAWDTLGLPSPWKREALFPRTRLAQGLYGEQLAPPDAYSLTHTVFFMTDWGAVPEGVPAPVRQRLAAQVPAWMESFRGRRDYDAYAELAAVLGCVGAPLDGAAVESVLRAAQEDDGAVPGPEDRIAERTRGIDDPQRRRFIAAYHTTLAAALASLAATLGLARAGQMAPAAEG